MFGFYKQNYGAKTWINLVKPETVQYLFYCSDQVAF